MPCDKLLGPVDDRDGMSAAEVTHGFIGQDGVNPFHGSSGLFQPGVVDSKELFLQLHRKALALGLNQDHFQQLKNLKRLKNGKKMELIWFLTKAVIVISFALLVITINWRLNWPLQNDSLAKMWFRIRGENPMSLKLERTKCLIRASHKVQDLARPPISCEFCAKVKDVISVQELSAAEFQEKFAYSGQPIVVQDGASNWSALDAFSFDFFKDIYRVDSVALKNTEHRCQFFPYKTDFRNLGEVFRMSEERVTLRDKSAPWYIGWSNCDASAGNLLRSHYSRPYFLPWDSESSKTDWIFMGSPGYGAHMHVDNVALPSWQAQITGRKRWTLQPPPECYGWCWHDLTVTVRPGEIIVLDTNKWYHSTHIEGSEISITIGSEFD